MLPGLSVTLLPGRYASADVHSSQGYGGYAYSPFPKPAGMVIEYNDAMRILHHQETLESSLAILVRDTEEPGNKIKQSTQQALDAARTSISFMRHHVDSLYNLIPPHERPPTAISAAKAHMVFSIPELLEKIMLSGLSAREKLVAMQVNRCWRNTVEGSKTLLRTLGLSLPVNSFYFTPFLTRNATPYSYDDGDFPGYAGFEEEREGENRPQVKFGVKGLEICRMSLSINIFDRHDLAAGSRVRSMTICNPPILSLEVTILCRMCRRNAFDVYGEIMSRTVRSASVLGFTVGEVLHQAGVFRQSHPHCAECTTSRDVRFEGIVTLERDDPRAKIYAERVNKSYESQQRYLAEHGGREPSESHCSRYSPPYPVRGEGGDLGADRGKFEAESEDGTESMYRDMGKMLWNEEESDGSVEGQKGY